MERVEGADACDLQQGITTLVQRIDRGRLDGMQKYRQPLTRNVMRPFHSSSHCP